MRLPVSVLLIVFIIIFGTSCFHTSEPAPSEAEAFLDEVLYTIKANSLFADSLDWNALDEKVAALSKNDKTRSECSPVIDTIVMALRKKGDKHSFHITKVSAQKINEGVGNKPATGVYLGKGIGYIKVPAFASFNFVETNGYASLIKNEIKTIDTSYTIKGWIVDLRENTGGNMYPMIAGLSSLTSDGLYGYFLSPVRHQNFPLTVSNGMAGTAEVDVPYKIKNLSSRIAVLIDGKTLSSGEMTAMSFQALPNVKFFGQQTGAYTTSNETFLLSDSSYLFLATAYMADRNKKTYPDGIVPDVITPKEKDTTSGQTIEIVKSWLLSK